MTENDDRPLVPSLLDRLIDDDPDTDHELPVPAHRALRELERSVQRDLEDLFNTRVRNLQWPAHLTELEHSLVSYGLPDFTAARLGGARDREAFCSMIEQVIRQNEPRLLNVRVEPLSGAEPLDRTFRFRIEAMLRVDPAPEPVIFDSHVQPATGEFEVREAHA
jgi:type VI secretion system protein ImpF